MTAAALLDAPALPQVDLLPPEVRAARGLRTLKRRLAAAVLAVGAAVAVVCLLALAHQSRAEAGLAEQHARTDHLLAEQLEFSEVPRVLGRSDAIRAARAYGLSTEVLWADYLDAIVATAPVGVTVETLAYSGASPLAPAQPSADVLADPGVGTVTFTGRAATVPDAAAWVDALDAIPGLHGARVTTATIADDAGAPVYTVASTVQVDAGAYARRFATPPTDQQKGDG